MYNLSINMSKIRCKIGVISGMNEKKNVKVKEINM